MKLMKNKLTYLILGIIIFVCILLLICFSPNFILANAEKTKMTDVPEEKVYCSATLEDEFENNQILIVLTNEASISKHTYTVNDFSEISCTKLVDLTEGIQCSTSYNEESFNRILELTISTAGKSEVLCAIKKIENRIDVLSAEPNYINEFASTTPNDTYYEYYQWAPGYIKLPDVWDITTGAKSVTVGVIDSGIDGTHPDLIQSIDTSLSNCFSPHYSDPLEDVIGHGTHVAGIIGAEGNNSIGTCGVCWNVSLVSLRVDNTNGKFDSNAVVKAITYATIAGLDIINYSGGGGGDNASENAAIKNYNGLFVCSSGNDGYNNDLDPHYPSSYELDNLIAVGSIDINYKVATTTNYGKTSVDIFAPGVDIYSTKSGGGYVSKSGTSMASPQVAGVAALLLSIDNTLDGVKLKKIICENVDKATNLTNKCVTGGRLNAYKAVNYLANGTKNLTVTFDKQGGTGGTDSLTVNYNQKMPKISKPIKYGYKFEYYYDDYGNIYYQDSHGLTYQSYIYNVPFDTTLHAYWSPKSYDLVFTVSGVSDTTLLSYGSYKYGDIVNISAKSFDGYSFKGWSDGSTSTSFTVDVKKIVDGWGTDDQSDNSSGGGKVPVNLDENIVDPYVVVYQKRTFGTMYYEAKKSSCIAEGSLITLADGSQKAVQELTGNEMLLVWNMFTGTFDTAPILCIDSDPADWYEVIKLYFSDGTQVDVISEHGFWDFDLNEYVYLDNSAEDYIGHWFNKQTSDSGGTGWTKVQLTDVSITQEYTTAWSPVTYGYLCYYVNGMLTMPGGIAGLFNIFEVDSENMRYDEDLFYRDIEIYGTYTYEEFAGLLPVTEELFNAVNGQYLKVAIGKGLVDFETLAAYAERYAGLFA